MAHDAAGDESRKPLSAKIRLRPGSKRLWILAGLCVLAWLAFAVFYVSPAERVAVAAARDCVQRSLPRDYVRKYFTQHHAVDTASPNLRVAWRGYRVDSNRVGPWWKPDVTYVRVSSSVRLEDGSRHAVVRWRAETEVTDGAGRVGFCIIDHVVVQNSPEWQRKHHRGFQGR